MRMSIPQRGAPQPVSGTIELEDGTAIDVVDGYADVPDEHVQTILTAIRGSSVAEG